MTKEAKVPSAVLIWILSAGCFLLGSSQQYLMGVPDQIAEDAGVELSHVSLLMTTFGMVNAIFSPVFLIATARFSQRRQLIMSMALMVIGLGLMGITNDFNLLMVARCIMGVGNGAFVATAYSFAQRLAEPGKQASAMSNVEVGFSAAAVLSMPLARALHDVVNWHWAYLLLAILAFGGIFVVHFLFPETKATKGPASMKERFSPLTNKAVLLALFCTFSTYIAYAIIYTYIAPYIDATMPGLGSASSIILFVLGIMSLLGTKACGAIADNWGSRAALWISLVAQGLLLLIIFALSSTGYVLVPFLMLWVGAAWMFLPVQNVLLAHLAGEEGAVMAISLSNSFLQLGMAIGAAVAGGVINLSPITMLPIFAFPFALIAFGAELDAFHLGKIAHTKGHSRMRKIGL